MSRYRALKRHFSIFTLLALGAVTYHVQIGLPRIIYGLRSHANDSSELARLARTGPLKDWRAAIDLNTMTTEQIVIERSETPIYQSYYKHPEIPLAETYVSPRRNDGSLRRGYGRLLAGRDAPMPIDVMIFYLSRPTPLNKLKRDAIRLSHATIDTDTYRVGVYWAMTPPAEDVGGLATRALLADENATHGDLHFFDRTYPADNDISGKVWTEYIHLAAAGLATFVFRLDDDVMVLWDVFLPEMMTKPTQGVYWYRQGSGKQGIYGNGPYLTSLDVVQALAIHPTMKEGGYDEDLQTGTIVSGTGIAWNLYPDERWHNDDRGITGVCLCRPWSVESVADGLSLVLHHVKPSLITAWMTDRALFSRMSFPFRPYLLCLNEATTAPNVICNLTTSKKVIDGLAVSEV